MVAVLGKGGIDACGEHFQRFVGEPRPMAGQIVVIKNIDQDTAQQTEGGIDAPPALPHRHIAVGKTIDAAMDKNSALDIGRITLVEAPLDEIPHQAPCQGSG